MGRKCGSGRRDQAPVIDLVGPRLRDADDAAEALRMSHGSDGRESIVVLVCDHERRILIAIDFDGAPPAAALAAIDCVIGAVPEDSALVVGLFRPHGSTDLHRIETEAVQEMADVCRDTGIGLLHVIVATDDRWRRLPEFGKIG